MALPQGINFRDSAGFVTDGANEDHEIGDGGFNVVIPTYPRTSAQGNTVGWEGTGALETRDRNSGNDRRLAGMHLRADPGNADFRIDLPSSGDYSIRVAAGDPSYSTTTTMELMDTTTSLGVLFNGSTGAANSFFDAGGTVRTAAAWPGQNALVKKTFSTTICRFRVPGSVNNVINHVYIETFTPPPPGPTTAPSLGSLNTMMW